jgi:hypothetical protein
MNFEVCIQSSGFDGRQNSVKFPQKNRHSKKGCQKSARCSSILVVREGLEPGASPKGISKLLKIKGAASPSIPLRPPIWHWIWH